MITVQDIKDLSGVIMTVAIVGGVIALRKDIARLVTWITAFRKIAKTHDGYEMLSTQPEPQPQAKEAIGPKSTDVQSVVVESPSAAPEADDFRWLDLYFEKKYDDALDNLQKRIKSTNDIDEQIPLRSAAAAVTFAKDETLGVAGFERLIEQFANATAPYQWYALSYIWAERHEEALMPLSRGIDRADDPKVLVRLKASCLRKLGRSKEAADLLEAALVKHPRYADHYLNLAELHKEGGDSGAVESAFRRGVAACPRDVSLISGYAAFLNDADQNERALSLYKKLVELDPNNPVHRTMLGNVYLNLKLNDKALESYLKADELAEHKQGWIAANIGNIYKNQGFYTQSIAYFRRAIEHDPESPYAHERLARALEMKRQEQTLEDEVL